MKHKRIKRLIIVGVVLLGVGGYLFWHNYLTLEPEDASPAWSPDGQRLAFSCHRRQSDRKWKFSHGYHGPYSGFDSADWYELCVVDVESGKMMRLTRNAHYDGFPTWSPDGLRIIYTFETKRQDSYDIALLTLDNLNTTTLIAGQTEWPLWSLTGNRLVYTLPRDKGPCEDLYLFEIDTGETQHLTQVCSVRDFAWSPDGKYVVFTDGDFEEETLYEVFIVSVDSGITSQVTFDGAVKASPVWSPDGHLIAFEGGSQIYVVDVSTLEVTQLSTDATSRYQFPAWSPDGTRMAYIRDSLENQQALFLEIKTLNQDGATRSYEISDCPVRDLQWSPDGKYLSLNQCDDWNQDGWTEFKIWLFDVEQEVLRPLYTPFPWQIAEQTLSNTAHP